MDRYTAIEFAKQRMKEIGKQVGQYHITPTLVIGTAEQRAIKKIILPSINAYYILVYYWQYSGMEILSDTGYFNADDYTNNTLTQEFTGEIIIQQLPKKEWSLEKRSVNEEGEDIIKQYPVNFIKVIF